jgi:hypothetical protein
MTQKLASIVVTAALLAMGCSKAIPQTLLGDLVQKQQQERLAIGWIDGKKLEIIVFGEKPEMRDYPLLVSGLQSATLDPASGLIFGTAQDPTKNKLMAVENQQLL